MLHFLLAFYSSSAGREILSRHIFPEGFLQEPATAPDDSSQKKT